MFSHQVRRSLLRKVTNLERNCKAFTRRSYSSELEQYNILQYEPGRIEITGYISKGFNVGQVRLFGSLISTTHDFFSWNVTKPEEITVESLCFFEYLNPTPDILIVGTGEEYYRLPHEIHRHFRENGIAIEEMNSKSAIGTFNVLNQEGRNVACAILCLKELDPRDVTVENMPNIFMEIEELAKSEEGDSQRVIRLK